MRLSVVVVNWNLRDELEDCLEALRNQSHRDIEVVVVDNASTDGSRDVARRFADRLPLELIESPDNLGFSGAANRAIRRCDGRWLLSLNPDCRLAPDFLARLVTAAERDERAGSASGLLLRGRGDDLAATDVVDSAGMIVTAGGRHHDRGAGTTLTAALEQPSLVFGASGAAALYRRAALDDVAYPGGEVFDETFFAYREDADLAWRLQRRGWSCLYWPTARAWHARGLKPEARRRGTPEINRHSVRNRFLLRWSNADRRWLLACFPWWLARDLVVVLACLTVERSSLPALAEAFALRRQQRARGRANASRATASGWRTARWFLPGGRVRPLGRR